MSTELMAKLFQLIQLKKFNERLNQRKQSMEDLGQSLMGLDLSRDLVVDDIKIIRTDVPFVKSKKKCLIQCKILIVSLN